MTSTSMDSAASCAATRKDNGTIMPMATRVRSVPLRRIAEPEEIADAVLWLAGSAYATGTVLTVDGGYTAR